MPVGFQKPKIKSGSAGPSGKNPGTSCHGKNPVSLSIAAIPRDLPPGSPDWVAAKNSGTSSASGREGGPKRTVVWPSGRGPKGTIRDPEDFPALVPPAGSSTNLAGYTLIQRFFEGPVMYWVPASMKNSNNYIVKLKFHHFWFIKNALFKELIDSFQQKLFKLNGSKESNGRVVYTVPGNLDVINNATLNIFSSIMDLADSPVLVLAVCRARTEWKKHVLRRGEAAELIMVIVDSAFHGDPLGAPGGVDDGGQDGQFLVVDDDAAYMLIFHSTDAPVLVRPVRKARTEWKKHVLRRGEAAELIMVIVDSAFHGDPLGAPGGVDDGGQDGQFLVVDDDAAYMLIFH